MNPEKQRIAIAEACGYKQPFVNLGHVAGPNFAAHCDWFDADNREIPDYLHDLNAMHEAEKVLENTPANYPYNSYVNSLRKVCGSKRAVFAEADGVLVLRATAAQRAEAFLRTINKWED